MRLPLALFALCAALSACVASGPTTPPPEATRAASLVANGCIATRSGRTAALRYFRGQNFVQSNEPVRNSDFLIRDSDGFVAILGNLSGPGTEARFCAVKVPDLPRAAAPAVFESLVKVAFPDGTFTRVELKSGSGAYRVGPQGRYENVGWGTERLAGGVTVTAFGYTTGTTDLSAQQMQVLADRMRRGFSGREATPPIRS